YTGGEDSVVSQETQMLVRAGHSVRLVERTNDEIKGYSSQQKRGLFFRTTWNFNSGNWLSKQIQASRPDILHVHNFFPLISPSIHSAAQGLNIPNIQHLHNFRLGCLNAYFYRNGQVCEACLGTNPWRGVLYRCYRSSLPASVGLWQMLTVHRWRRTWHHDVDAFITPSTFAAQKMIEIGIPEDKLYVKPNAIEDPRQGENLPLPEKPVFVFAGRLSPEKGAMVLLRAWCLVKEPEWRLRIVGDGPEKENLQRFCHEKGLSNVSFEGYVSPSKLMKIIQSSSLLVVPSQWYETFGRVVIEAFACGRGAMISNLGALAELVQENVNGCLVESGDTQIWAERIRWTGHHRAAIERWGKAARHSYEMSFMPDVNYRRLLKIYTDVAASS
ncbi:MAG: glycosyltransferase family 4 protein, partial [Leptolyngbya sp. SIO4C1]|nr:glycosyltransferase family 4 protein [Leptolyngbya sp. SIO4C1]